MEKTTRPWGTYEVLYDGEECKVKKIVVKPKQNPSYQYHFKRRECWVVVSGTGYARLEEKEIELGPGSVLSIPLEAKHTIVNTNETEDLVFIEVQTGTYFGEDDIVRLEDLYGRA